MNHICTWICLDEKGEESLFPQSGKLSSSLTHQNIYWRCVLLFFITSRRFHSLEKHVLFTNAKKLPVVDGKKLSSVLADLDVEVVHIDFNYKTPAGYYGAFQNQFFEFSVLEHIACSRTDANDLYLLLDSDCIFTRPVTKMFEEAAPSGFMSFIDPVAPGYVINGLSRNDLKELYEVLLQRPISEIPDYHLGEFLLCSVENIKKISHDFIQLWPRLMELHSKGQQKFNEEAHTLSYLYFRNGLMPGASEVFMKRIWTNPLFYRNVEAGDVEIPIWHLPAEKTFGLHRLYELFMKHYNNYGKDLSQDSYQSLIQTELGIPRLSWRMKMGYYTLSYARAIKKRLNRFSRISR